ncbi:MAG TPA: hypothetical protein DEQ38_01705 [Elusimicrobia bacterium]|nr:MAG: hypothetical protein A2089_10225 [Elusimicrobia bacterium GWD2_63_28]HCC46823.1 hypothetical protein [Elusimicrobiota bacterium]
MKIALINPRNIDTTTHHPLGLLYIAAYLEREGHLVKVFDQTVGQTPAEIASEIIGWGPELSGLTATTPQFALALRIAAELKKVLPAVPVVVGGPHPSVCPEDSLASPEVDFVVIGEGERTLSEICAALGSPEKLAGVKGIGYKAGGKPVFTGTAPLIEDLDSLPFPARHLLAQRWYFAPPKIRGVWTKSLITVMASRGCPYRCIWCSSHTLFGRKVRNRSPENVLGEIAEARRDLGVDSVYFFDDTFTVNTVWTERFCELLAARGWKDFKWACQARVNTVTPDLLAKMKKAGCVQLDFGVESGSQRILDILVKDTKIDMIKAAFRHTRAAGINTFASIIVGAPGETREDVLKTSELLAEIRPDYTEIFYATPYPGTRLYEIAKESGLIRADISYDAWYVGKQIDKPMVCFNGSEEELVAARTLLQNQVLARNLFTIFKDPGAIPGGIAILFSGAAGLLPGLKRFVKTGNFENILVEVLKSYRQNLKDKAQAGK